MRKDEIIELLESLRLPEIPEKKDVGSPKVEEGKEVVDINTFINDPVLYGLNEPFLIYDNNNETIISRTAKGINDGKLNPFEVNWMAVTLYRTDYERLLLERIDSVFIKDVAQAIDDEDARHISEDGYYTNIVSSFYGTGQKNNLSFSYNRDNWHNDDEAVSASVIAEGILDQRIKAENYNKKLEVHKKNLKSKIVDNMDSGNFGIGNNSKFSKDIDDAIPKGIEESNELTQSREECEKWKRKYEEILSFKIDQPEVAYNGLTKNECFSKAKMGLLIYTVASITDGPIPVKSNLAHIISAITGFEEISVGREIAKAGFRKEDIEAVAELFQEAMPHFANEIRKQVIRNSKSKK